MIEINILIQTGSQPDHPSNYAPGIHWHWPLGLNVAYTGQQFHEELQQYSFPLYFSKDSLVAHFYIPELESLYAIGWASGSETGWFSLLVHNDVYVSSQSLPEQSEQEVPYSYIDSP